MPIKVDIHDNSQTVRAHIQDNSQEIKAHSGCCVDDKRLEALIKEEAVERKDADIALQLQIDGKQDNIQFIYLSSLEGIIEEEMLNLLISNKVNRLVYNDIIYYLSIVDNNIRKYFSRVASSEYNEIDVNTESGHYIIISKMDPRIEAHINNNTIHITEAERLFWNNKVTTDINPLDTSDNILILKNN